VDIVTVDPVEWAAGELLLPTGRWREPKAAIRRGHAACVQDIAGVRVPDLPIPSFTVRTEVQGIYKEDAPVAPEKFKNRHVVAFAGIAKPERFFSALESLGVIPAERIRFRDHHRWSGSRDYNLGGEMLITTERRRAPADSHGSPCSYLRISAKIPDFEGLMSLILNCCSGGL
jgi:tetraacyldisaccharide 4'-kinase